MTPHVISATTNADAERPRTTLPRAVPFQKGDAIEGFAEGQPLRLLKLRAVYAKYGSCPTEANAATDPAELSIQYGIRSVLNVASQFE
jgi:hypothetical protein